MICLKLLKIFLGCGEMDIISIAAVAIICTVISVVLKQYKPEYALLVSVACIIIIFINLLSQISPILTQIIEYTTAVNIQGEYIQILIKALGISYLAEIAGDICKDMGQNAIATKVQLAGKFAILILCIPLFENLIGIARELINV